MAQLSIIVPIYNGAKYIKECLEMIINQTFKDFELIIIDDGSTDNSVEVLAGLAARQPQIKVLKNERNMGAVYSSQRALLNATGDFLIGHGSDDRVLPGFIEKSVKMLLDYPEAGLCCSDPAHFESDPNSYRQNCQHWSAEPRYLSPLELADVITGSYIPGHTSVFRRASFMATGGYLPQLEWHSDWFINLVIGFRHGICYLPEALSLLRVSPDTYSGQGIRSDERQQKVLVALLSTLRMPEYRDVLPLFVRSSALSCFGQNLVFAAMAHPEFWDAITLFLIGHQLHQFYFDLNRSIATRKQTVENQSIEAEITSCLTRINSFLVDNDLDRALQSLSSLCRKFPQLADLRRHKAKIEMLKHNYDAAIQDLFVAVQTTPQDTSVWLDLGIAAFMAQDHSLARRSFTEVMNREPDNQAAKEYLCKIEQIKA